MHGHDFVAARVYDFDGDAGVFASWEGEGFCAVENGTLKKGWCQLNFLFSHALKTSILIPIPLSVIIEFIASKN